jgi:SAM-dependent methyltransferase
MQKRHADREKYFYEQSAIAEKVLLPYIESRFPVSSKTYVAEIGCGEAGNLHPFLNRGCKVTGIDYSAIRIERANKYYARHPLKENLTLIANDIFDLEPLHTGTFDLIILRDSLEHITYQEKFLLHIKEFLNPDGIIFISFPPWQMPFGGHQQLCENSFLGWLPYIHLFPEQVFVFILKLFREKEYRINELLEIRNTRISIEKFRQFIFNCKLTIEREDLYFINPAYKIKFKLNPIRMPGFFNIPYLRNFYTTACYYILSYNQKS